ncbi:MAG: glucosylceramidase [Vicinamibacteria bacterium]|nr:glucosylceramidase [Vicinamibacteria bacterium]
MSTKAGATASAVAYISTAATLFEERPVADVSAAIPDVAVYPEKTRQTIEGFGGAFNEKGWQALSALSDAGRRDVLSRLFDPVEGIGFTICRVPIGASDYALDRYTLNENPGDYTMRRFSIERDRAGLIPYVKAAMVVQPKLRLWASVWTPPTWMKDNQTFDSGAFLDDPKMYDAYALYLLKFIQAYRAEGLPVDAVAVQNEPGTLTNYPSCGWTAAQYLTFIKEHLGPLFRSEGLADAIMLGTFNQPNLASHALTVLTDSEARQFVSLAGMQWYAISFIDQVKRAAPGLTIWQTETDCGNWPWLPGFDPEKPQNDIVYAGFTWEKIRDWLKAGVTVYELWNMVLDPFGKSIDADMPWPQNCPITVDAKTRAVRYTPMFRAVGSFSKFVPPGSKMVETEGSFENALAFLDSDGRIIIVLYNPKTAAERISVRARGATYGVEMPAQSFATIVLNAR